MREISDFGHLCQENGDAALCSAEAEVFSGQLEVKDKAN